MPDSRLGRSVSRKPPVQCGNCGAEITFEPGQLVGDPGAIDRVKRYRAALAEIVALPRHQLQGERTWREVALEALRDG